MKGKKIFIPLIVLVFIVAAGGIYWWQRGDALLVQPQVGEATDFTEKIQSYVVENIGQPIEGFSADIYLRAFPGLLEADFDRVKTREGVYAYTNSELEFVRTRNDISSSAEEAISKEGHQILFENIRGRLGLNLSVDEIINGITAQGLGKITGAILFGPTCPVLRDL
ncbi:MAG: hypothetical protein AAB727_02410, partial [Patescibacteria group bacterium]